MTCPPSQPPCICMYAVAVLLVSVSLTSFCLEENILRHRKNAEVHVRSGCACHVVQESTHTADKSVLVQVVTASDESLEKVLGSVFGPRRTYAGRENNITCRQKQGERDRGDQTGKTIL